MRRKIYPTLVKAAENITQAEQCQAPELSTLVVLDATLLATLTQIEFNNPQLGIPELENRDMADEVEEHIVDSIFILARALRSTLSAYYAGIQKTCGYRTSQQEISF